MFFGIQHLTRGLPFRHEIELKYLTNCRCEALENTSRQKAVNLTGINDAMRSVLSKATHEARQTVPDTGARVVEAREYLRDDVEPRFGR